MPRIFPEYRRSTVYALIGAAFHFVVVVLPLLVSGATGEAGKDAYWLTLFFDFPLFFPFLENPPIKLNFLINSINSMGFVWYISIFGSLLYALGGWVIGYLKERK